MNRSQRRTVQRVQILGFSDVQNSLRSTGDRPGQLDCTIAVEDRLFRFSQKRFSSFRWLHALGIPIEEPNAQTLLKVLNLLGKTRLGYAQPIGGTGPSGSSSD
jgi:hypothetical protein